MEKKYDLTALGELLIDFQYLPESATFKANPGGAPANVLSQVAKLGGSTAFIGKVGRDVFGRQLRDTLQGLGIAVSGLVTDNAAPTTLAFVTNGDNGEREFAFYRSGTADTRLSLEDIDASLIAESAVFHFGTLSLTYEPAASATRFALEIAKNSGCLISFDPNLRPALWDDLGRAKKMIRFGAANCDIMKIAKEEAEFAGLSPKAFPKLTFVTDGANGSDCLYKGAKYHREAYTINAADTTGAGDAFMGAVLHKLTGRGKDGIDALSKNDIFDALEFANAAGAIVATRHGALLSMASEQEIKNLLKK
ncbi:MAG: carbohydrate kinase [Oscillospiraceae bacterium]|jgi:fructokinase|nr:carbohydrate kinase [Oscillospiraceae bacterium]